MANKLFGIADPYYDALRVQSNQAIWPDAGGSTSGLGGVLENKIYVWHADGSTVDLFDPTDAGLTAALAAAASGDTVWIPSFTISGNHTVPAGVGVYGIDRTQTILTGQVTLSSGSSLGNLSISRSGGASNVTCVVGPSSGIARVISCLLLAVTTSGTPLAASSSGANTLTLEDCQISALKNGTSIDPFGASVSTLIDTFSIDSSINTYQYGSVSTTIGVTYRVEVSGDIQYENPAHPDHKLDANYVTTDNWSTNWFGYNMEFSDGSKPTSDEGTYQSSHVYNFTRTGTGAAFGGRVGDSDYTDNVGSWTVKVYELGSTNAVNVEGCEFDSTVSGIPQWGDRGAWDALNWQARHANDIDTGSGVHHTLADLDLRYGNGHVIQDDGTPLTQRPRLDFVGNGVTGSDDPANNATVLTIPGDAFVNNLQVGTTSNELFTLAHGVNEFDLLYEGGYYHWFYTTYEAASYETHHRAALTVAGLATAADTVILPINQVVPTALLVGSTWHVWTSTEGTRTTNHYTASNPDGPYTLADTVAGEVGDPHVRKWDIDGNYYMAYVDDSTNWKIGLKRSSSTSGPWTDLGYIFSALGKQSWYANETDPAIFFVGQRAYVSFGGLSVGLTQVCGLVELDTTTWKAMDAGTIIVSPTVSWMQRNGASRIYNPVWLEHDGLMYFAQNPYNGGYAPNVATGWGYQQPAHPVLSVLPTSTVTLTLAGQLLTADMIPTGIDAADLGSGTATNGQVLTADGAGGAAWQNHIDPINVYNETQTADGVSLIYYLTNYAAPSTIRVYIDGIRQPASDDVAPSDTVVFSVAPDAGAVLLFDYEMDQT